MLFFLSDFTTVPLALDKYALSCFFLLNPYIPGVYSLLYVEIKFPINLSVRCGRRIRTIIAEMITAVSEKVCPKRLHWAAESWNAGCIQEHTHQGS